jgi:1,4-alpha-glucan branching enzyme
MSERKKRDFVHQPMSIYEVHLGSWRKNHTEEFQTYRQMADELVNYVRNLGFTHVELLPLMEHPFYGSWGYQALGYFAPTARYGTPEDLMYLIDQFHQAGIGVIWDWVVSHFPNDDHGIANFDGTKLFEQREVHPDWQSCIFNLGKHEIKEFLISSAIYWMEKYHIDALRVDAVASMLYLDYSKKEGEWEPNIYGGHENLEAIAFIRALNAIVKEYSPDVQMIAEESTAWPHVTRPCAEGGLEFDMKWNMGWMHDTLRYFSRSPDVRGKYNEELAFCLYYAFSENFILSLSHDEVVYGKGSLITKMPGDDSEKFSNLRALFSYMYGHPGKKLLFMGGEFAQWKEWDHDGQLEWELTRYDRHQQIQDLVRDLNQIYRNQPALHERDFTPDGFEWLDMGHDQKAIFSFLRKGLNPDDTILVVCNFMNASCKNYTVGVPSGGIWTEILNSGNKCYGGQGTFHPQGLMASRQAWKARGLGYHMEHSAHRVKDYSLTLHLPALSVIYLKQT